MEARQPRPQPQEHILQSHEHHSVLRYTQALQQLTGSAAVLDPCTGMQCTRNVRYGAKCQSSNPQGNIGMPTEWLCPVKSRLAIMRACRSSPGCCTKSKAGSTPGSSTRHCTRRCATALKSRSNAASRAGRMLAALVPAWAGKSSVSCAQAMQPSWPHVPACTCARVVGFSP